MPRVGRSAPGGVIFHVLNRGFEIVLKDISAADGEAGGVRPQRRSDESGFQA